MAQKKETKTGRSEKAKPCPKKSETCERKRLVISDIYVVLS